MTLSQDPVEWPGPTGPAVDRDHQPTAAVIPFASVPFADLGGRELLPAERGRRTEAGNADRATGSGWLVALARGVVLRSPYGIASTLAALRSSPRRHSATDNNEEEGR